MSTPRTTFAWFRAWGRAALFGAAAAAAALSLSAYTPRTRALAMRQVYFNAWHILPGFTLFAALSQPALSFFPPPTAPPNR